MVSVLVLLSMVKPLNTPPVIEPPLLFTLVTVKLPPVIEPPDSLTTIAPRKSPPVMELRLLTAPGNVPSMISPLLTTSP